MKEDNIKNIGISNFYNSQNIELFLKENLCFNSKELFEEYNNSLVEKNIIYFPYDKDIDNVNWKIYFYKQIIAKEKPQITGISTTNIDDIKYLLNKDNKYKFDNKNKKFFENLNKVSKNIKKGKLYFPTYNNISTRLFDNVRGSSTMSIMKQFKGFDDFNDQFCICFINIDYSKGYIENLAVKSNENIKSIFIHDVELVGSLNLLDINEDIKNYLYYKYKINEDDYINNINNVVYIIKQELDNIKNYDYDGVYYKKNSESIILFKEPSKEEVNNKYSQKYSYVYTNKDVWNKDKWTSTNDEKKESFFKCVETIIPSSMNDSFRLKLCEEITKWNSEKIVESTVELNIPEDDDSEEEKRQIEEEKRQIEEENIITKKKLFDSQNVISKLNSVILASITNALRPYIYYMVKLINDKMKQYGTFYLAGGDALNMILPIDKRLVSIDIDTKFVLKYDIYKEFNNLSSKLKDNFYNYYKFLRLESLYYFDYLNSKDCLWNYALQEVLNYMNNQENYRDIYINILIPLEKSSPLNLLGVKFMHPSKLSGKSQYFPFRKRFTPMIKRQEEKDSSPFLFDVDLFAIDIYIDSMYVLKSKPDFISKKFVFKELRLDLDAHPHITGLLDLPYSKPMHLGYKIGSKHYHEEIIINAVTKSDDSVNSTDINTSLNINTNNKSSLLINNNENFSICISNLKYLKYDNKILYDLNLRKNTKSDKDVIRNKIIQEHEKNDYTQKIKELKNLYNDYIKVSLYYKNISNYIDIKNIYIKFLKILDKTHVGNNPGLKKISDNIESYIYIDEDSLKKINKQFLINSQIDTKNKLLENIYKDFLPHYEDSIFTKDLISYIDKTKEIYGKYHIENTLIYNEKTEKLLSYEIIETLLRDYINNENNKINDTTKKEIINLLNLLKNLLISIICNNTLKNNDNTENNYDISSFFISGEKIKDNEYIKTIFTKLNYIKQIIVTKTKDIKDTFTKFIDIDNDSENIFSESEIHFIKDNEDFVKDILLYLNSDVDDITNNILEKKNKNKFTSINFDKNSFKSYEYGSDISPLTLPKILFFTAIPKQSNTHLNTETDNQIYIYNENLEGYGFVNDKITIKGSEINITKNFLTKDIVNYNYKKRKNENDDITEFLNQLTLNEIEPSQLWFNCCDILNNQFSKRLDTKYFSKYSSNKEHEETIIQILNEWENYLSKNIPNNDIEKLNLISTMLYGSQPYFLEIYLLLNIDIKRLINLYIKNILIFINGLTFSDNKSNIGKTISSIYKKINDLSFKNLNIDDTTRKIISLNGNTEYDIPEFNIWNNLRTKYKSNIYSNEDFSYEEFEMIKKHVIRIKNKNNIELDDKTEIKNVINDTQNDNPTIYDKQTIYNQSIYNINTLIKFDIYDNTYVHYDIKELEKIYSEKKNKIKLRHKETEELNTFLYNITNFEDNTVQEIYKNFLEDLKNTVKDFQNKFIYEDKNTFSDDDDDKPIKLTKKRKGDEDKNDGKPILEPSNTDEHKNDGKPILEPSNTDEDKTKKRKVVDNKVSDTSGDNKVSDTSADNNVSDTSGDNKVSDTSADNKVSDTSGDNKVSDTSGKKGKKRKKDINVENEEDIPRRSSRTTRSTTTKTT